MRNNTITHPISINAEHSRITDQYAQGQLDSAYKALHDAHARLLNVVSGVNKTDARLGSDIDDLTDAISANMINLHETIHRMTGRTTKIIDNTISRLLQHGEAVIRDHIEALSTTTSHQIRNANAHISSRVKTRLVNEHSINADRIDINVGNSGCSMSIKHFENEQA